ncbi:MAG TPA: hypothetical protein VGM37_15945 [Armatimonadota bacterium]|jgi:hypothetical protein
MKRLARPALAALLMIAGFAGGSALAEKGVEALSLRDANLFAAAEKAHASAAVNVVFASGSNDKQTFSASGANGRALLTSVAAPYKKEPVCVTGIYVLQDALPASKDLTQARSALGGYLKQHLPHGQEDGSRGYARAEREFAQATMKSLRSTLPAGDSSFASLSPAQQDQAMYLLRYNQVQTAFVHTYFVFGD